MEDVVSGKELGGLMQLPVFVGGPVGADQLTFAAFTWQPGQGRIECRHHLDVDAAQEMLRVQNTSVRAFIGYAGWGKGQLEAEIAQNAWLVAKATMEALDRTGSKALWRQSLSGFGPWYRLVAESPDDLSRN